MFNKLKLVSFLFFAATILSNKTDKESWLNDFPVRGRTNYPLLFDRDGKSKSAFDAVIKSVGKFVRKN